MSLVDYLSGVGIDNAKLTRKADILSYESRIWEYLEARLGSRGYNFRDTLALRCAFETATELHRGEKRKTGTPYIIHPAQVLERLIEQEQDYETLAGGILHDTVESLLKTGEGKSKEKYRTKKECLDIITSSLSTRLNQNDLSEYVAEASDHVRAIVGALSREKGYDFYEAIDQIFRLPELDLMRALIIKCTDRYVNTLDTLSFSLLRRSRDIAKTYYVAAKVKEYMWDRLRFFKRAKDRVEDFREFCEGMGFVGIVRNLEYYWNQRQEQKTRRDTLFKMINTTIEDLSRETESVISQSLKYCQSINKYLPDNADRQALRNAFRTVRDRAQEYARIGGFEKVTKSKPDSIFDGIMNFHMDYVINKNKIEKELRLTGTLKVEKQLRKAEGDAEKSVIIQKGKDKYLEYIATVYLYMTAWGELIERLRNERHPPLRGLDHRKWKRGMLAQAEGAQAVTTPSHLNLVV